jgi:hypothetical protein
VEKKGVSSSPMGRVLFSAFSLGLIPSCGLGRLNTQYGRGAGRMVVPRCMVELVKGHQIWRQLPCRSDDRCEQTDGRIITLRSYGFQACSRRAGPGPHSSLLEQDAAPTGWVIAVWWGRCRSGEHVGFAGV